MRTGALSVGIALCATACLHAPAGGENAVPTAGAPAPTAAGDKPSAAPNAEDEQPFGLGPDAVVVVEWDGQYDEQRGEAYVVLPTGERLTGRWTTMDSNIRRETPSGSAAALHPSEDPGDPTSMPRGRAPATIVLIELRGDHGTRVSCTIPIGRRSKSKTGKCHSADTRYFSARMR